ncbi:MAG: serine hydrolase [Blastocatellia bacterium]|nr:serine hydrolase [Blastocatellia bacterium]
MLYKYLSRLALALILVSANAASFAFAAAPQAQKAAAPASLDSQLAAIEKAIEEKRAELSVPGFSLVIVKDDRVIYVKGFGFKDVERNLPVTQDTLFAIGSCTKAFTAMAAAMSADDGKLSLSDSPKKFLPYFKLQDPEADSKITVRDLLCHNSGLARTDIPWYTGVLDREEVIKVAGVAKPSAKFREKFQYQNVMYSAAGEVVARAQNSTWERVIQDRFFKPLGMKSSNTSVKEMQKSMDFAIGYDISNKPPKKLALRDLTNVAPAGAINSNVKDMARWIRLMLGEGVLEGKRLVSEKGFAELVSKQTTVTGKISYGLGWMLNEWNGHKTLSHGGGIDGFNSLVSLMPDQKLGFAVLTNVSGSPLPGAIQETIFSTLVGKPEMAAKSSETAAGATPAADPKIEVGSYRFAEAGFTIKVVFREGRLIAEVPGQPNYPLVNVGGRRYKLDAPAPPGFFMTFRPMKGDQSKTEMYLEQPHGNYVVPKLTEEKQAEAASADYSGPHKELLGSYEREGRAIEITAKGGKAVLVVPGQPPYTLVEKGKDNFGAVELPEAYSMSVNRNAEGKVSGIVIKQPEGEFAFNRAAASSAEISITVEELMAKVIEALGGEANLRKHHSLVATATLEIPNQGLTGESTSYAKAPNLSSSSQVIRALGREIGTTRSYFDGAQGGSESSFAPSEVFTGKTLDDISIASNFAPELNWKTLFKTVTIKGMSKVGDEEVYTVVKTPEKGNPVTDYISAKSFLLLRRDTVLSLSGGQGTLPVSERYSDYRPVDGVMIPFKSITDHPAMGEIIAHIKEGRFNVEISDSRFRAQTKK